jgi:hypothetical protein
MVDWYIKLTDELFTEGKEVTIMAHIQASIPTELAKEVRKDAIDKDESISDYVKVALVDRLKQSKQEAEAGSKESSNQTT